MSYSNTQRAYLDNINLRGGRLIQLLPSATDPAGCRFIVVCDEHKETIPVDMSEITDSLHTLSQIAQATLSKCRGCIDKTTQVKTRFPEGSEL